MSAICGIFGVLGQEVIRDKIKKMCAVMRFRGPDIEGYHVADEIGLGACIWRSVGDSVQPVYNEDRTIVGVCDGEIYNWKELADSLKKKGHELPLGYDNEVIVHMYEEFGFDFPLHCNGIFGVAIWDTKKKTLILARDHAGSKPIFYARQNGNFVFASTIKGLLKSRVISKAIDPRSVNLYFGNTCVPHPKTMFQGIFNLRPGHTLIFKQGFPKEHRYWDIESITEDYSTPPERFEEEIRNLVIDSIKIRVLDNRIVGSILSGGVDSSTIISVLKKDISKPLEVFSVRYDEVEYDDSPLQKIMLRQYDLVDNAAIIKPEDVNRLLSKVVQHSDYPINNASAMGTFLCFELARGIVDVVFDGEAADELFCGGGGVVGEKFVERFTVIPYVLRKCLLGFFGSSMYLDAVGKKAGIKRLAHRIAMPEHDRMLTWLPAFDQVSRMQLLKEPYNQIVDTHDELSSGRRYLKASKLKDKINLYQYGACKTYLCNDLLFKNERMASANGIINRTPFIDYRLIELAFKIPAKYKLTGFLDKNIEKKVIYRNALAGLIPDEILWRRKTRGFSQPTSLWMRKDLKEFVRDILLGDTTIQRGILNKNFVEKILSQHLSGQLNQDRLIWGLLTFELWMREYVDYKQI